MDVKLAMFLPDGKRKDLSIRNRSTLIGRGDKCDLRIPLLSVSRRHCELAIGDDGLHVKDLGSSNGTFVNNQRVTESPLSAGDRLAVGPIIFTVQIDGAPEEIGPVTTRGEKLAGSSLQGQKTAPSLSDTGAETSQPDENADGASLEEMVADALRDEDEGRL